MSGIDVIEVNGFVTLINVYLKGELQFSFVDNSQWFTTVGTSISVVTVTIIAYNYGARDQAGNFYYSLRNCIRKFWNLTKRYASFHQPLSLLRWWVCRARWNTSGSVSGCPAHLFGRMTTKLWQCKRPGLGSVLYVIARYLSVGSILYAFICRLLVAITLIKSQRYAAVKGTARSTANRICDSLKALMTICRRIQYIFGTILWG